jgi:hypothetical protein
MGALLKKASVLLIICYMIGAPSSYLLIGLKFLLGAVAPQELSVSK